MGIFSPPCSLPSPGQEWSFQHKPHSLDFLTTEVVFESSHKVTWPLPMGLNFVKLNIGIMEKSKVRTLLEVLKGVFRSKITPEILGKWTLMPLKLLRPSYSHE